jgi:hypothetical protein
MVLYIRLNTRVEQVFINLLGYLVPSSAAAAAGRFASAVEGFEASGAAQTITNCKCGARGASTTTDDTPPLHTHLPRVRPALITSLC